MKAIDDFFNEINTIKSIPEHYYHSLPQLLEDLSSYSRIIYNSIYLVDYFKRSFAYVSDNPLFLCGHSSDTVKSMGFDFFIRHCPKEDIGRLMEIYRAGFAFLKDIPVNERCSYSISYDFNMVDCQNEPVFVNHQLTPYRLTDEGKVWLALCAVSFSTKHSEKRVKIFKMGYKLYWEYHFGEKSWIVRHHPELSSKEKQVITLSAMGHSMEEIARLLGRSVDTVKFYRKSIFDKLGVDNITEAISYSMCHRLV